MSQATKLILTRYFYSLNEVTHTLLISFIEKKSFKECLFWISELYYSKFYDLLWDLLWKIYYDFYAINNPKFEKFITKCNIKWNEKKEIHQIIDVANILYYSKNINNQVFNMRLKKIVIPSKIYRGRNPKWIKHFDSMNLTKKEKVFIRSLDDSNFDNIKFYFKQIQNNTNRLLLLVKHYFNTRHNFKLKEKLLDVIPYKNKSHIVLCIICYLFNDVENINKRLIKKKISKDDISYFEQTNIIPNLVHKTLHEKRMFGIDPNIGLFENHRIENYNEVLWYNWEYFTQGCPLWDERFLEFKCKFDKDTKKPIWENDNILENFYEKFGFEPDEQNNECQNKSLQKLNDTPSDMLYHLNKKSYL